MLFEDLLPDLVGLNVIVGSNDKDGAPDGASDTVGRDDRDGEPEGAGDTVGFAVLDAFFEIGEGAAVVVGSFESDGLPDGTSELDGCEETDGAPDGCGDSVGDDVLQLPLL